MRQFGVATGQRPALQSFSQPMAEIKIWNGGTHLVPADQRLSMALRFEQLPIDMWDRFTPETRRDWLDAVDWLNRTIQKLKLEDAGV